MERQTVSSSNLVSVGYEEASSTLEIEFNSGVYQYYDVPSNVYTELMSASSLGSYFHHNIKGKFPYRKM